MKCVYFYFFLRGQEETKIYLLNAWLALTQNVAADQGTASLLIWEDGFRCQPISTIDSVGLLKSN